MWVAATFLLFAIVSGFYGSTYFCGTDDQEAEPWQLTFRAGMAIFCAFACGSCLGIACDAVEGPAGNASGSRPAQMPAVSFWPPFDGKVLTGGYAGPKRAQKSAHSRTNGGDFSACFRHLTRVEFILTSNP
jgi:hypothetical protein